MHDTIDLARSECLTIYFVRRPEHGNITELIVFRWPNHPTELEPARLAAATKSVMAALAEARIQLAAIRASEM
jgi:hypothetical protein